MPAYTFEALQADGKSRKGVIEADTAKAARALLRGQALVPLAVLGWDLAQGGLGPDPVAAIEHRLGRTAVYLLLATLSVTPILRFGRINLVRFRRALGLLTFLYAALHLAAWVVLDMGLMWSEALRDVVAHRLHALGPQRLQRRHFHRWGVLGYDDGAPRADDPRRMRCADRGVSAGRHDDAALREVPCLACGRHGIHAPAGFERTAELQVFELEDHRHAPVDSVELGAQHRSASNLRGDAAPRPSDVGDGDRAGSIRGHGSTVLGRRGASSTPTSQTIDTRHLTPHVAQDGTMDG